MENKEEARMLRDKIKETANSIREVDGKPITLYLSIGYALYSEFLDLADQTKNAEIRLLLDYDQMQLHA